MGCVFGGRATWERRGVSARGGARARPVGVVDSGHNNGDDEEGDVEIKP